MSEQLRKNLANLHAFWSAMAETKKGDINSHTYWPNKIWRSTFQKIECPHWQDHVHVTLQKPSLDERVGIQTQLTAMHLDLGRAHGEINKQVSVVRSLKALKVWCKVCSQAFGYEINISSLMPLLDDSGASILVFTVNSQVAGTAISYQTLDTMGIHQVGVSPDFQRRGIGKAIMLHLIEEAKSKACKVITLQASQSGLPMYSRMGFTALAQLYHLKAL